MYDMVIYGIVLYHAIFYYVFSFPEDVHVRHLFTKNDKLRQFVNVALQFGYYSQLNL